MYGLYLNMGLMHLSCIGIFIIVCIDWNYFDWWAFDFNCCKMQLLLEVSQKLTKRVKCFTWNILIRPFVLFFHTQFFFIGNISQSATLTIRIKIIYHNIDRWFNFKIFIERRMLYIIWTSSSNSKGDPLQAESSITALIITIPILNIFFIQILHFWYYPNESTS